VKGSGIPNSFDENLCIGAPAPKSITCHITITGDFIVFGFDVDRDEVSVMLRFQ
jgi:hypothetical protein